MINELFKPKHLSRKLKKQWETHKHVDSLYEIMHNTEAEITEIQNKCKHPQLNETYSYEYGFTTQIRMCPICKKTITVYMPYLVHTIIDGSFCCNTYNIDISTGYLLE